MLLCVCSHNVCIHREGFCVVRHKKRRLVGFAGKVVVAIKEAMRALCAFIKAKVFSDFVAVSKEEKVIEGCSVVGFHRMDKSMNDACFAVHCSGLMCNGYTFECVQDHKNS